MVGDAGAVDLAQVVIQREESGNPRSFRGCCCCRKPLWIWRSRSSRGRGSNAEVVGAEENGLMVPVFGVKVRGGGQIQEQSIRHLSFLRVIGQISHGLRGFQRCNTVRQQEIP